MVRAKNVEKTEPRIEDDTPIKKTAETELTATLRTLQCGQRYVDNFSDRAAAARFAGRCKTAANKIEGCVYKAVLVALDGGGYVAGVRHVK